MIFVNGTIRKRDIKFLNFWRQKWSNLMFFYFLNIQYSEIMSKLCLKKIGPNLRYGESDL